MSLPNQAPNRQFWLAELDIHGNPKLTDGAHSDAKGANHALYLIQRMGFAKQDVRYAVAEVILHPATPDKTGANEEALDEMVQFLQR